MPEKETGEMILGLLSIEALYLQQGPPSPPGRVRRRAFRERETPSRKKAGQASVHCPPWPERRAEKCSWRAGGSGKGGMKPLGKHGPLYAKRFGGVGATFT